ncbi:MAG TPA: cyclase family protein [Thermoanaerobaculia bacterium]|jgi:kynurenine formamidase|nr:cyclase family protein [Thermoanaerobaculia bacterium]
MHRHVAVLALLALAACATAPRPANLATGELVDLSWPFDEHTLYWPTSPTSFELKQLAHGQTPAGWFYASNSICTPEHGGTHLDAPIHFSERGRTADQIPLPLPMKIAGGSGGPLRAVAVLPR